MWHVYPLFNTPPVAQKNERLCGLCSWTCSRCLPGNCIVHTVTAWFDLLATWKAAPGLHFKFSFTVNFSPCQMEWKMQKKKKKERLEEKRWIFAKVRAFGPPGYLCFCVLLSTAKSCVCEYVCTQRVFFLKIACTFEGLCLYQFTTAPELMQFRTENKAVHFNSLASGARQPAVHKGATVAVLYVCAR